MSTPNKQFISNLEKYRSQMTGEFGQWNHSDAVDPAGMASADGQVFRRSQILAERGYAQATSFQRRGTVSGIGQDEREQAHEMYRASAELDLDETVAHIRQMPEDYNPHETGGNALSGNRLGHRMQYGREVPVRDAQGNLVLTASGKPVSERVGPQVRVRSATSLKAFAREPGVGTFSIPVEYEDGFGNVTIGHVALTKIDDNNWDVQPHGISGAAGTDTADRIGALLEGRRVTTALNDENVIEKRRARISKREGLTMQAASASWFDKAAIIPKANGMAVLAVRSRNPLKGTGEKATYGYEMPYAHAARIVADEHGATRLAETKAVAKKLGIDMSVEIQHCDKCNRIKSAVEKHRCVKAAQASTEHRTDAIATAIAVKDGKRSARAYLREQRARLIG